MKGEKLARKHADMERRALLAQQVVPDAVISDCPPVDPVAIRKEYEMFIYMLSQLDVAETARKTATGDAAAELDAKISGIRKEITDKGIPLRK